MRFQFIQVWSLLFLLSFAGGMSQETTITPDAKALEADYDWAPLAQLIEASKVPASHGGFGLSGAPKEEMIRFLALLAECRFMMRSLGIRFAQRHPEDPRVS